MICHTKTVPLTVKSPSSRWWKDYFTHIYITFNLRVQNVPTLLTPNVCIYIVIYICGDFGFEKCKCLTLLELLFNFKLWCSFKRKRLVYTCLCERLLFDTFSIKYKDLFVYIHAHILTIIMFLPITVALFVPEYIKSANKADSDSCMKYLWHILCDPLYYDEQINSSNLPWIQMFTREINVKTERSTTFL